MRVAVIAGPDPGHAFPAIALCLKLREAGEDPILLTATRWLEAAREHGIFALELQGLAPRAEDDDDDAGAKLHSRAARMSTELLPDLRAIEPDLVVTDVLLPGGGMAAERLGIAWVELSPHPLYAHSRALPPIGSGLAPGVGLRGWLRDTVLRAATARSMRQGQRQRAAARVSVGLPAPDPGPRTRLIATLPALEVPRPDWPDNAHLVGPLLWEPTSERLEPAVGSDPLILVSPSTAFGGTLGMVDAALEAFAPEGPFGIGVRMVATVLDEPPGGLPNWARVGLGRQDVLLEQAALVVCGGGHGMLAKALLAGVPSVLIPGWGDQWELANRAARQGSAVIVRPLTVAALGAAVRRVLDGPSFTAAAKRAATDLGGIADPVQVCREAAQ